MAAAGNDVLDEAVVAAFDTKGLRGAGLVGVVADGSAPCNETVKTARQDKKQ